MLDSLRKRMWTGMGVLIALVFLLFSLSVKTIRSLDNSVAEEVGLLLFLVTVIVNALARLLVWSVGGTVKAVRE